MRWSIVSKKYVNFEEARQSPLKYLTHLNRNASPEEMIGRFYSNRELARSLLPNMRETLENRSDNLPSDIFKSEAQALEWYQHKGWKLWLF
jgi:hypothetical protein